MLFRSIFLAVVATLTATVQADCQTGKILGKFAVCGSNPIDCGSGLCCQSGSTCVPDDALIFRCALPMLSIDSTSSTNNTVLLNAGCYDVVDKQANQSATASSSKPANSGMSSSGQNQGSSQNASSRSKLSAGAIAGIVIGSVIVALLLIATIATLFLLARRRRNSTSTAITSRQEMGERSDSSDSGIQKPAVAVMGRRSSNSRPRPVSSRVSSRR